MEEVQHPVFRVRFHDGPAAGITREYETERPTYRLFGWTYENAGRREGDFWLYLVRPKSRVGRRIIGALAAARGVDPRLLAKPLPNRVIKRGRNAPCWCGSGKKYKRCHNSPQQSN